MMFHVGSLWNASEHLQQQYHRAVATFSCYCTGLASEPNRHHLHQIFRAYLLKIIAAGFVNILSEKGCGEGHLTLT